MRVLLCCLLLATLAGCGLFGSKRAAPGPTSASPAPGGSAKGGYYLDDGPGAKPPADIDSIPDAVPRAEPLHKGALRPYTVMGRNYVPMSAVAPYRTRGVASWYGRRYHGKLTAIGEPYDMYGMSAAHPTLPLPSYVRVTSVSNGRAVVVRVNDRGPFIDNRLIDLSYTAAHKLGIIAGGSAQVEVEAIVPGMPNSSSASVPTPAVARTEPAGPNAVDPAQIPLAAETAGVHLQIAAFSARENAEAYATRLRSDVAWLAPQVQVFARDNLFRVYAGPYGSQAEARLTAERLSQSLGFKPLVIIK